MNIGDPNDLNTILENVDFWHEEEEDYFIFEYYANCIKAIGKFGNSKHIPMLREISKEHKSPTCRAAALLALKNLNDEKIVDLLIESLL